MNQKWAFFLNQIFKSFTMIASVYYLTNGNAPYAIWSLLLLIYLTLIEPKE